MVEAKRTIKDVCNYLDKLYPSELAWELDLPRIGFILGNSNNLITKSLLTLDVTGEVIDEAINLGANLIITHHPFIFNPIYKIDFKTVIGQNIKKLIENDIAIYALHTNFDVGVDGVADMLANFLELKDIVGSNEADSYLRVGKVTKKPLESILKEIKDKLKLEGLKYARSDSSDVEVVGIMGGSGGNDHYVEEALKAGVDLYISSEFKLSSIQNAVNNGMSIVEINHGVEKLALESLVESLTKFGVKTIISKVQTDPFKYF